MDKAKIAELIQSQIADTDLFVVDIAISLADDIDITMDSDTRVTIEQCIALSRAVEAAFDREQHDYSLTIGSAGVGSPLRLARQFDKVVGCGVDLVLKSGIKVHGTLSAHNEQGVTLTYMAKEVVEGKKRKVEVEKQQQYDFEDIKTVCESLVV